MGNIFIHILLKQAFNNMQEDKQLLFKTLCALLPYNTIVSVAKGEDDFTGYKIKWYKEDLTSYLLHEIVEEGGWDFIKPYLRPMSSMTEKEKETYHNLCYKEDREIFEFGEWVDKVYYHDTIDSIDYLNSIHVDYRSLIDKGLAIEAPEGMYV